MTEQVTHVNIIGDIIVDVDWSETNSYLAITNSGKVITSLNSFSISKSFRFPLIRILNDHLFLVGDTRVDEQIDNCFVFDLNGTQLIQFFAGDGIQDILIVKEKIIVTYFDEGIFGADGPNNHGLVIFDINGNVVLKWNSEDNRPTISDCYCACKKDSNRIFFSVYPDFPLVDLNLDTFEKTILSVPKELHGSSSISAGSNTFFFHGPYEDKRGIYKWTPENNVVERIAEYTGKIRGLNYGRFLSKGDHGFTVIDVN